MAKKRETGVIPDEIMAEILLAIPGAEVPPARRSAMGAKLLDRVSACDGEGASIVRAGTGKWLRFAPNVEMKILHDDGRMRSWLARFGPGGSIPAHIQTGDEEAFILEGWCLLDSEKICAGDYHRIGVGQRHGNIVSPEGCLIFVRSHSEKRHASDLLAAR